MPDTLAPGSPSWTTLVSPQSTRFTLSSIGINYWLKSRLLEAIPPGERAEFWLGGRAEGRHSEHQPGTWTWDHMNETISWFDWADGQPNNYDHQQMCLTLREYHDPFFPIVS